MQNSMWKFATLLGVIGIGCLVIVQVQKGLKKETPLAIGPDEVTPAKDAVPPQNDANPLAGLGNPGGDSFDFDQFEPGSNQSEPSGFSAPDVRTVGFEDTEPRTARPIAAPTGNDPVGGGFDDVFGDDAFGDFANEPSQPAAAAARVAVNPQDEFGGQQYTNEPSAPGTLQPRDAAPMDDAFEAMPSIPESNPNVTASTDDGLFGESPAYQPERTAAAGPPQDLPAPDAVFGDDPLRSDPVEKTPVAADPVDSTFSDDAFSDDAFGDDLTRAGDPDGPTFGDDQPTGRTTLDASPPAFPRIDNSRSANDNWPPGNTAESTPVPTPSLDPMDDYVDRAPTAPVDPVSFQDGPVLGQQDPVTVDPIPTPTTIEPAAIRAPITPRVQKSFDSVPHGTLRPQLRIQKSAPASASIGKPLIYSILIKNVGNAVANEVIVEDQIPRGARLTGTIPQAELVDGILLWRFESLEPNQQKEIKIRVVPEQEGQIGSVATVNFRAEIGARTTVTAPRLRLEVQGQQEARIGDVVEFRYRIINEGTGDATNVMLKNPLPPQLQHKAGTELEYPVGDLPAGKSTEVTLQLVAATKGLARNSAVVTADGIAGDQAEAQVSILGAQLKVTRRGPSRRYLNRDAIYENTVTNTTNRDAENARLVEFVPEGMQFVDAKDGGQYNSIKRTITWPISVIRAGQSRKFAAVLRPVTSGMHESIVEIVETTGFKSRANSRTQVVDLHNMGLQLSELSGPLAVGEEVVFTVNVRNRGTSAATGSVLQLKVPRELRVLTAGPTAATQQGDTLVFPPVPEIAPKQTVRFQVKFQATSMADNVRLRASIRSDQMPKPLPVEESITIYDDEIGGRQ